MQLDWLHLGTLIVIAHILGGIAACHAILNTRTSQGAIAWAVSLTAVPYLTLIPYLFLGRSKFSGYVDARRSETAALRTRSRPRAGPRTAARWACRPTRWVWHRYARSPTWAGCPSWAATQCGCW